MRKSTALAGISLAIIIGGVALAAADPIVEPIGDEGFWGQLGVALGALFVGSTWPIVIAIVQLAMLFVRATYGERLGVWRLVTLLGLTVLLETLTGLSDGKPMAEIIRSAVWLSSFQVFAHQLFKQVQDARRQKTRQELILP